jgi:hypothetical protein
MSLDRVSSKTILQTGDTGTVDTTSAPGNLQGAKGVDTGGTTGGTVPGDDPQTPPQGLGLPKDTHALGSKITGKREEILDNLPGPLSQALHDKIANGEAKAKDLKALLHFSYFATKGTTPETRVEIRTILAQAVASGMSLEDAAALKAALRGATAQNIAALREGISASGSFVEGIGAAIHKEACKSPDKADAKGLTALCKVALAGLPADPAKSGQRILQNASVIISHDGEGQPHVEYASARCIPPSSSNVGVTTTDIGDIRKVFDEVCGTKYSRMNPHLQLMEAFREARSEDRGVSLGEVFDSFRFDGNIAVQEGNRGDRLSLTSRLVARLGEMGFNAQVIGEYNDNLPMQSVNRQAVDVPDKDSQTGGVTHTDVIVPYISDTGEARIPLIQPGLGATDDNFPDMTADAFTASFGKFKMVEGGGGNIDVGKVSREAMGYLTNLQMKNTPEGTPDQDRQMFGVDLIGGTVYLNGNSSKTCEGLRLTEGGVVSFNDRDIMDDPLKTVDLKLANGRGGFDTVSLTQLEALTMFLEAVAADCGRPRALSRTC